MDENKILEFMLKKEMLVKEVSLINSSKYYNFTHKIQVSGKDEIEQLISYLHESIHYYLNNLSLCDLSVDFANLFNYLKYFYILRKSEIFENYSLFANINDIRQGIMYMMSYTHELDIILAKDSRFVDYCKFCVDIFDIYIELQDANEFFNEGLATYYSLNAVPKCFLFECMEIPDVLELAVRKGIPYSEISKRQDELKNKILSIDEWGLYNFSYRYTNLLSETYGDNYLLYVLLKIISSEFNIYDYDLISFEAQKRKEIICNKLSYTKMYGNLMLKIDEILPILLTERMSSVNSSSLFEIITNHSKPLRNNIKSEEIFCLLNKRFFKHPKVIKAIENLLNRKMKDEEYYKAFVFSSYERVGDVQYALFEKDEIYKKKEKDLEKLIQNNSIIINKNEKYAEKNFIDTYNGMKEIIYISSGE